MLLFAVFRRQCNWPLVCWTFFRVLIGIVVFAIVIDLTVCGSNNLGNWLRVANVIVIIRFCVFSSDAKILPPKKFIDQLVVGTDVNVFAKNKYCRRRCVRVCEQARR